MNAIVDGIFGGDDAATEAANIQAGAAREASALQQRQFEQTREDLSPFREAALPALAQQQALLGLGTQEERDAALAAIHESPGQQFIRERAQKNLLRNASAVGGIGGGNILSALVEQGAGFASQDLQNQFGRLGQLTGAGQNAAAQTGQFGQASAQAQGNLINQAGQAQAQGVLQAQQANAGLAGQLVQLGAGGFLGGSGALKGVSSGVGGAGTGAALSLISDEKLKKNVRDLSSLECFELVQGLDLKAWEYIEAVNKGNDIHFGPMAAGAPECIKVTDEMALDLHDELNLIAGAIQYLGDHVTQLRGK